MTTTFLRYCLVGITGTLVDFAVLYSLVEFGHLPVLLAATVAFFLAVVNNFTWNKHWTFKNKSKNYRNLFLKFLVVSIFGLVLTLTLMFIFVDLLGIWYILAKVITAPTVLTWNFLSNKFWTFSSKPKKAGCEKRKFKLSIVIPTFNEEARIGNTIDKIYNYLKSNKILNTTELIIVDDGSSDGTLNKIALACEKIDNLHIVKYHRNVGKGYAIRRGIEESEGEKILFLDADNSTPIEYLDRLSAEMRRNNADVAIGSRYLEGSEVENTQSKFRIRLSRAGNFLVRFFILDGIVDTQCGFKLFKSEVAKEIFALQKVKRFGFDIEVLVIAKNFDFKVIEVPVDSYNSSDSKVRPILDSLIILKDLFYIKMNLWSGRYSRN